MKKIIYGLVLLVFGSTCSDIALASSTQVEELVIDSDVLSETRKIVIFLPASYNSREKDRFPVLYLTDGDIQGPHSAGTLNYLAKFDQTPEMIVVGIVNPRDTRTRDLTVTSTENQNINELQNADRFLAFVEKEVISSVKARYRTLDYQALSGTSHGGQFAIYAWIKRPDLFDGIIAISPSLYWNNNQLLELSKASLKQNLLQGRLYISIADEEPIMTEPYKQFVELFHGYSTEKLAVKNQTFSDETHNTTALQGQYYGLKHLFSDWPIPESPQTLSDLQTVFSNRSELLKKPFTIPEDRAAGYGQWLQYLNRQKDAIELLSWNKEHYPQSLNAHTTLIKAFLHFNKLDEARAAQNEATKSIKALSSEQQQALENLVPNTGLHKPLPVL